MQYYRDDTIRVHWDNYACGVYFVTICTHGKLHYFGEITDGAMRMSAIGTIVDEQIISTPSTRHDMNLEIIDYVIMPNHVHLLMRIGHHDNASQMPNDFEPQRKNLASVIGGIKRAVTSQCNASGCDFKWQPRYYDEIIRFPEAFYKVMNYIDTNVARWANDEYYGW